MKKITTIIFDFDGVIANTLPFTFKKAVQIAKILTSNRLSEKQIVDEIRNKDWRELLRQGGYPLYWLKLPIVLTIIARMQVELGKEIETIRLFPGIKRLLSDLKKNNFRLAILSSNLKKNIEKFIKIHDLDFFEAIEAGTFSMMTKDIRIKKIIEELKVTKEETIYIGDEIRDMEASKKVEIKAVGVSWGLHKGELLRQNGADFVAKKPKDILKFVDKN